MRIEKSDNDLSLDFMANITEVSHFICFIQLTSIEWCICNMENPWEQVAIYIETDGEITIQYEYWSSVEAELQKDPSCEADAFSAYILRQGCPFLRQSPFLLAGKSELLQVIKTSSWFSCHSNSICIFQQSQDLSKECDCSLCWLNV